MSKATGKVRINCYRFERGFHNKPTLVNWYITNHYADGLIDAPAFEKKQKRRPIQDNLNSVYFEQADFSYVIEADEADTEDKAEIIRTHEDTWCSVRMGDYMFLLCIGARGASDTKPSVIVVDMKFDLSNPNKARIVFKSDDEIIQMIRETSEVDASISDDDLMYDFARNEYI